MAALPPHCPPPPAPAPTPESESLRCKNIHLTGVQRKGVNGGGGDTAYGKNKTNKREREELKVAHLVLAVA